MKKKNKYLVVYRFRERFKDVYKWPNGFGIPEEERVKEIYNTIETTRSIVNECNYDMTTVKGIEEFIEKMTTENIEDITILNIIKLKS